MPEEGTLSEPPPPDVSWIYEAYHARVLACAARLLGREDADDVAQEVFIKIGRSLGTLADSSKLASWVYAITLNTVRDAARKRSSAPRRPSGGHAPAGEGDPEDEVLSRVPDVAAPTPEEKAIRNEMVSCYMEFVNDLPVHYYDAYVLSEFEDLSNEEIARRLSLSVGTVKIRLHRARARLQRELRANCRCYYNERGELMGAPKEP